MSNKWLKEAETSPEVIWILSSSTSIPCFINRTALDSLYDPTIGVSIMSKSLANALLGEEPLALTHKYAFLNGDREAPVINSDKLFAEETFKLLTILEKHQSVLGYSLQDLKGISPALCAHRIPIEPSGTLSREPQRRLNNAMREVVKKEVLKLLHAGIIYPVPNSKWVRPIQVAPKKGGMMVVQNDKNELIPQRTVMGWRIA